MAVQKGEGRNEVLYRNWSVTGRADEFDAWVCMPDLDGRRGGVVVAHDRSGVTPALKQFAFTIARMGYAVVVPDLYYRAGIAAGAAGVDPVLVDAAFGDGRMLADLADTTGFLRALSGQVDDTRLAVLGIGSGGRLAMLLAARDPLLFRSVVAIDPILGKVELPDGSVRRRVAIEEISAFEGSVQALVPAGSGNSTEDEVERLAADLADRGQVVVYPEAGAGFWSEDSPNWDPDAASDMYARIVGFLDATVGDFTT